MADRRAIMRIQLDAQAKEELDDLCDKRVRRKLLSCHAWSAGS